MERLSDNALTFTFKVDGDSLNMTNPTGRSNTAQLRRHLYEITMLFLFTIYEFWSSMIWVV
jgi:hypothetical protein